MEENKKEHFSKSVIYLISSQILIKMFGLIYSLYLINKKGFGDAGNALYLSSYQFFSLMLTISAIGVPNAVASLIAKCEDHDTIQKVFKTAIYLYSFISVLGMMFLFVFSNIISEKFIGVKYVNYNLKILSPILLFATIESVYLGLFNGTKQMKITARIQFLEQVAKTIITIISVEMLSLITNRVEILSLGATIGVVISIIIGCVLCFWEKKKIQICRKRIEKESISYKMIIKFLLKFSIPISIGAMLVSINKNIDSFSIMNILSLKIGKSDAQKIYGIIASKIDVLVLLPLAFNITFSTALIPNISEATKNNDYIKIKTLIKSGIYMSFVIGIGSTLGLCFFSKDIFDLLFSSSKSGEKLLKLSAFSVFFSVLTQTFSGILQGMQKNKIPVFAIFLGTISKIFFNIILVKQNCFLEKGIIISTIISNCLMFIILYYEIKKEIKINIFNHFFIVLITSIFMVFIISSFQQIFGNFYINKKISFAISLIIGGSLYFYINARINNVLNTLNDSKI